MAAFAACVALTCVQTCGEYTSVKGRGACYDMCKWTNATEEERVHMASMCKIITSQDRADFFECFDMEQKRPADTGEISACEDAWREKGRPGSLGEFCAAYK